jgi:hypothetical protein
VDHFSSDLQLADARLVFLNQQHPTRHRVVRAAVAVEVHVNLRLLHANLGLEKGGITDIDGQIRGAFLGGGKRAVVEPQHNIILGGYATSPENNCDFALVRYTPGGDPNLGFGTHKRDAQRLPPNRSAPRAAGIHHNATNPSNRAFARVSGERQ